MSAKATNDLRQMLGKICRDWWGELAAIDPKTGKEAEKGWPDRAALAELRRIASVSGSDGEHVDAAVACRSNAYVRLFRRLESALRVSGKDWAIAMVQRDDFPEAVAVVAATLARVRQDTRQNQSTAYLVGRDKKGDAISDDNSARLMAEARFKRLIRTRDWPGLLDQGRRIVALLDRNVPVADLGASLLLWNCGPRTMRDWSFAYYGVAFAAPDASDVDDADDDAESSPAA
jgi:hypothetical protein